MHYAIQAKETEYKGTRFRSRLEARWAAYFDLCEWPWVYEPIELKGWVPDFILQFHRPIAVEVKPLLAAVDFEFYDCSKMNRAGWNEEILLLGAIIPSSDRFGYLTECVEYGGSWDWARAHTCFECGKLSFHHSTGCFSCRVCDAYEGDGLLGPDEKAIERWNKAGTVVRFNI